MPFRLNAENKYVLAFLFYTFYRIIFSNYPQLYKMHHVFRNNRRSFFAEHYYLLPNSINILYWLRISLSGTTQHVQNMSVSDKIYYRELLNWVYICSSWNFKVLASYCYLKKICKNVILLNSSLYNPGFFFTHLPTN